MYKTKWICSSYYRNVQNGSHNLSGLVLFKSIIETRILYLWNKNTVSLEADIQHAIVIIMPVVKGKKGWFKMIVLHKQKRKT